MVTGPQPDFAATLVFLKNWMPEGPWCLTVIPFDRSQGTITATFYPKDGDAAVTDWLSLHNRQASVYFVPNPVRGRITSKAKREDVAAFACLHVDLDPRAGEDFESEKARILALARSERPRDLPSPSVIIFSGGGYQLLWRFAKPIPIKDIDHAEDLKRYNIQIENLLGGDHCHDVCRLLRLPGTINWLNAKKVKAGRKPALAKVVESWDERVYDLDAFVPAPDLQEPPDPATGKRPKTRTTVEVSGNLRRLDDVNELGEDVPGLCKVVIVQGDDPDDPSRFGGDRSKAVWYVTCELVRRSIDDDTIFSVLTDPGFGISAHVLEQPNSHKYTLRQIEKAKEAAIDADLRELNERYMVIMDYGSRCMICREIQDDILGRATLSAMSYTSFREAYANRRKKIGDDKDDMPLAVWWFLHPERRQYERVVFEPEREVAGCYNLWRGFAVEPRPGDCSLFLDHLLNGLCNGDQEHYNYLLRWMANVVQRPGRPGEVAVVLKGRQGTGKSFFAKTFGQLFGRHYLGITDSRRLVGNFNAHLRDCVLLFADEAFYAGDKKHESNLKGLITELGIAIEGKGRDIEYQRNCLHLIMASNEDWAVPASLDDRRFFILSVTDDHRNQRQHFTQIENQMKQGGYSGLLDILLKLDLSDFDVSTRPETTALKCEKLNSMEPIAAWWYERLSDGLITFAGATGPSDGWPNQPIPKEQMTHEIRRALGRASQQRFYTAVRLRQMFTKLFPKDSLGEVRPDGRFFWKDIDGEERHANRPRCWVLPELSICRKFWDQRFGALDTWLEVEEESSEPSDYEMPF